MRPVPRCCESNPVEMVSNTDEFTKLSSKVWPHLNNGLAKPPLGFVHFFRDGFMKAPP